MRHGINKGFCQSVPQVTLNNFTPYKYFVKFKSSCPKRRLCCKISETEQNDVTNDVIDQKRDLVSNKDFAKIILRFC